ncbi:MAG TPA: transcriptional repressor [Oscillatoriaceae cyanobacterium]
MLKRAGINPTAQRIAICRFVLCEADHPTAEVVKAWVDENFPKMSLATVYNTLRILVDAGLLRELRLPHTDSVLYDNNLTDHVHFLDEASGVLYDVPRDRVAVTAELDPQFEVARTEVLFRGRRR